MDGDLLIGQLQSVTIYWPIIICALKAAFSGYIFDASQSRFEAKRSINEKNLLFIWFESGLPTGD